MLSWTAFLWAINLHQRSHNISPSFMAQSFSDSWSSRQRHYSFTTIPGDKQDGAPSNLRKASALSTRIYQCKFSQSAISVVPCKNAFLRCEAPAGQTLFRSSFESLLICQSTNSDATSEIAAVTEKDASSSLVVNDVDVSEVVKNNGVNVKGNSKNVLINIIDDRGNDGQRKYGDNAAMEVDVPVPTANGGYAHTSSSKAKISAANRGKVPWNKGTPRSHEVRARIAEGVRRRNRERFLVQLAEENISEEEYLERKKAERRKKDSERRTRRTVNGGYTPTEETKQKISQVLKEKYATGEVKRAPRDPAKVRRGFRHSEATKSKIRESLKRKWAEDTEYRDLMTNKTIASGAVASSVRRRIAETLKKKWEDPEFRAEMLDKFANRRAASRSRNQSHRQRISVAMKKKWMDEEYRKRALQGMARGRESASVNNCVKIVIPIQPKLPSKKVSPIMDTINTSGHSTSGYGNRGRGIMQVLDPMSPRKPGTILLKRTKTSSTTLSSTTTKTTSKGAVATKQQQKIIENNCVSSVVGTVMPIASLISTTPSALFIDEALMMEKHELELEEINSEHYPDGCISRLREERRDLYDLLYGDEDKERRTHHYCGVGKRNRLNVQSSNLLLSGITAGTSSNTMAAIFADDDDLDDFDPYGLHDISPSSS